MNIKHLKQLNGYVRNYEKQIVKTCNYIVTHFIILFPMA